MSFDGHPENVSNSIKDVIKAAHRSGLTVTATTDGTHAPGSYHYSGRAVDVAAPLTSSGLRKMRRFQKKMWRQRGKRHLVELFGPINDHCVSRGVPTTLGEGTALETQHDNHVHVAI